MIEFEDVWMGAFVAVLVAFLCAVAVMGVRDYHASVACLAAGYPNSQLTFGGAAYCIKRVDQTDVVVRLDSLKER